MSTRAGFFSEGASVIRHLHHIELLDASSQLGISTGSMPESEGASSASHSASVEIVGDPRTPRALV